MILLGKMIIFFAKSRHPEFLLSIMADWLSGQRCNKISEVAKLQRRILYDEAMLKSK